MRATASDVVGDEFVSPFEIKSKPDLPALYGNEVAQRAYCPRDMEVVDEFPECQEESFGITSAYIRFAQERANALESGFLRRLARMPHRTLPYADEDSSFRSSGLTSPFHFQMAKMGG